MQPSIIAITETKITEDISINIPNYEIIRKDRDGNGGGVLLAINKSLQYTPIKITQYTNQQPKIEIIGVRIKSEDDWITVSVCYNPDQNCTQEEFDHYFYQLPRPVMIIGDFNARHQAFETDIRNEQVNKSGRELFNSIHIFKQI